MVGRVLRTGRECLYEQCSDHRAEKTPSSVNVGVRPSSSTILLYSSSLRLCSRTISGVTGRSPGAVIVSVTALAMPETVTVESQLRGLPGS